MNKGEHRKVVYIPMCADIVHTGHIKIIKEGQKLGEVTVGLLTDKAIASYKRPPFMNYSQRLAVIRSIKGVKKVVSQTTLDYRPNLRKLKPDYVVHGTDWRQGVQKKTRQQAIDTLKEWGGSLIEPKYTEGISSTLLRKNLKSFSDEG
jgi:phosphoenolpyruvate phosphomutase / 2-hydroxyethylphosphonate cytidylyltransferase